MSSEVILPKPPKIGLEPFELTSDYPLPQVLNRWADGSMRVRVSHNSAQHIINSNPDCFGQVDVPIPRGATGDRIRFCNGCGQEVTVRAVGAIRVDVYIADREEKIAKQNDNGQLAKV